MYPESRESTQEVAKYFGKYAGIVLDHSAVPADAAKRGQIKVRVPGILEESPSGADQAIEVIARPSFISGFFFIPEANAQVWVEFVAGDINFPIWTGVWYPDQAAPHTADGSERTRFQKVIRTVSGHVVQIDDTNGWEQVVIQHKSGSKIEIDHNGKITITDTGNDTSIVSSKISLGTKGGAAQKMVRGDDLKAKLEQLIDAVQNHFHPTGVGPSGPDPALQAQLPVLKGQLGTVLSTQNTTD